MAVPVLRGKGPILSRSHRGAMWHSPAVARSRFAALRCRPLIRSPAMTHHGSCHCGAVAFDLEGEVSDAIDCNCSMCRRRGGLLAFFPREALTLTTPESNYGTYRFNKEHPAHRSEEHTRLVGKTGASTC